MYYEEENYTPLSGAASWEQVESMVSVLSSANPPLAYSNLTQRQKYAHTWRKKIQVLDIMIKIAGDDLKDQETLLEDMLSEIHEEDYYSNKKKNIK